MLEFCLDGIKTGINDILTFVKQIPDNIIQLGKDIGGFFGNLIDVVVSIPAKIIELLGELLKALFVPSDDYFPDKIDTIRSKFAFADSVVDTVQVFVNFFQNNSFGESPTITVNLSSSGSIDYGTSSKAIDFKWYEPFKPTVDLLISSILWVVFVWNTFKDLSNIINGGGSFVLNSAKISQHGEGESD